MHIAAAMGTPTVALFGPSGEVEWRPWRVAHRVVASDAILPALRQRRLRRRQGERMPDHASDGARACRDRRRPRAHLKIAIVRQRYNPYGGAERFAARALNALAARGVGAAVVTRDWAGAEALRRVRSDPRVPFHVGRLWRDWGFARAACARLARERFDLVQSHERISCCDIYRAGDGVHREWLDRRAQAGGAWTRFAQAISPYHRYVLAAERRMFASRACAR